MPNAGILSRTPTGLAAAPSSVPSAQPVGGVGKRAFDILTAAVGLVVAVPLFGAVAATVALSGRGPVFFAHTRIGRDGRRFRCLKFRTMVTDGEAVLARHLASDPGAAAEWAATRKLKHDPRVTAVGRILRKTSLDELPQLINILRGDMSVVGPRPVVEAELERYGPRVRHYLAARPGLTGLWQVSGRNAVAYRTRVALDCHYVATWSMVRDIQIMAMTVPAVVARRGCY